MNFKNICVSILCILSLPIMLAKKLQGGFAVKYKAIMSFLIVLSLAFFMAGCRGQEEPDLDEWEEEDYEYEAPDSGEFDEPVEPADPEGDPW